MSGFSLSRDLSGQVRVSGRWLLLGAVMIGLLTMHFLSAHDSAGDHRVLTPTTLTAAVTQPDRGPVATAPSGVFLQVSDHTPTGDGHAVTASCALLLLAAAVVTLLGALIRRQLPLRPRLIESVRAGGLRGPPKALSRRALCVERI